jgi:hypothetical protein
MQKILPKEITSYDLLKTFAVVIMVVDHVGFYIFPDQLWWRAIGRIGFPIWFFLVGYANTRDIPPKLWAGALILLAANFFAGMSVLPLNALVTIILIRLVIDAVMRVSLEHKASMFGIALTLAALVMPSCYWVCEYGTQALITAMFGYAMRHRSLVQGGRQANATMIGYAVFSLLTFIFLQEASFNFTLPQFIVMAAGTLSVTVMLYNFKPMIFPRLSASCPGLLRALIRFTGRHTLEIYVFHLLALKALALQVQPRRFVLFGWTWLYRQ